MTIYQSNTYRKDLSWLYFHNDQRVQERQQESPNPIWIKRKPQLRKRWFSLKNRLVHFYINNSKVIRPVKRNKLIFSSTEINKPHPAQSVDIGPPKCEYFPNLNI